MNEERKKFLGSLAIPALLAAIMLAVKIIETALGIDMSRWGIIPHTAHGLIGIFTLPFLHGNWEHLIANVPAVLVLGTALYYCYPTLANRVMLISWLGSGLLTWLIGNPGSCHVGASALIYSLNLFLILSGFIRGNRMLIVISLIMVFLYGGFIWGMIPALAKPQNISWEGHLSGAIVGVTLAFILKKKGPQKEVHHWEDDDDSPDDNPGDGKPYWDIPTPSDEDLKVEYRFRH
ncbi:MAG: rhomboid family intramembrane serine protease [Bacteroidales bacterium]|nr:rhomboid family intramembrane serine protease [Bacteroidales bacterium]